ncbi:hypothetical protein RHSIM_RhsimUnG0116200 [Rhododendron simsii]|uniref:Uncharacterized protein n=1 Tax=Rhododendron simsii TaxID=118357 RepID=A0A834FUP9_RHOSS|nr:hypothetical protein RHSIM_RhsimUnG0116200 [Rhododendron simsii]
MDGPEQEISYLRALLARHYRIKSPIGRRWRNVTMDASKLNCKTRRRKLRLKVRIHSLPATEGNVIASTTDSTSFRLKGVLKLKRALNIFRLQD